MARDATTSAEELLEHAEWVRRLARALVRDPDAADDLAQDAMEVALTRPPAEAGPVRPWLGGVVRNLARMGRRTDGRRAARERALGLEAGAEVPSPETLVERARAQQRVARLVLELDEPLRQTMLLRFYEGYSSAEIARKLDIPAGTVRWRLSKALERVRVALDREHGGDRKRWAVLIAPLAGAPVPAPAAPTSSGAGLVQGALLVNTSTKVIAALVVIALALFATHRAGLWGGSKDGDTTADNDTGKTPDAPPPAPAAAPAPSPIAGNRTAVREDDPVGKLRLEGQVIDGDENPVAGAVVAIDTQPPRTATSGEDGSFAFDGLIGRDYGLEARADDRFAGPLHLRLTGDTEPVILRVRAAPAVEIEVIASDTGEAIAGAEVEVRSLVTWSATTGADGIAKLTGVGANDPTVRVSAAGYATVAQRLVFSGDAHRERIALHRGAAVAGTVVDDAGKPIAGARVLAIATAEPFPVIDPARDGVTTDAKGRWSFPAIAAGTYRFTARATDRAPGHTAPMALDGKNATGGIEIRLEAGGRVSGKVIAADGTPVVGADVRLVARGTLPWRTSHQAYSGEGGAFALTGLPRRAADVVAADATGSSELVAVALDETRELEVELRLTVTGAIAGVVVDDAGAEIPEAQVIAEPAWTGNLGERESWAVRGMPVQIADGGGAFHFAGLPAGSYRLRAARPGAPEAALWLPGGMVTATGTTDARLVVPASGAIKGRVLYADGSAPELFTLAMGPAAPVPVASKDGGFQLEAPGGTYNVTVAGPSFARTLVEAKVAGGITDLGTITVEKGRSISGRVLDASGAPVAGAMVAAGALLTGDGTKLYIEDESINAKTTTTDDDGRYVIAGFGPHSITAVAGKDGTGRSASITVPAGPSSAVIDLVLTATGGLEGTMTMDGKPLAETVVIANPIGATSSNFFVVTGADGSYALDALTAGEYTVFPMIGGGGPRPKDMYVSTVTVAAGTTTKLDIAATSGTGELELAAVTDKGKPVAIAQVMIVGMEGISSPTAGIMGDGSWLRGHTGDDPVVLYIRSIMGGSPAVAARMVEGTYSACVVPFPVDPGDMAAAQRIMARRGELPMKCQNARVSGGKTKITVKVPEAWTVPAE